jgi:hypothetical protein
MIFIIILLYNKLLSKVNKKAASTANRKRLQIF